MIALSLDGKVALVTGAARGIGRAIALRLAQAGCRGLAVNDLCYDEDCGQLVEAAEEAGTEPLFLEGDVSQPEQVRQLVDRTVEKWGRIDILVNNAGIAKKGDFFTTSEEQWDQVLGVNLRSAFVAMKYAAGYMKEQGGGAIVNMSSMSGLTGGTQGPDYSVTKAGMISLTKFGARTLTPHGIRVNALAPGYIDTALLSGLWADTDPEAKAKRLAAIPLGRMGDPEEVANVAVFLASDLASYVSGEVVMVSGGRMS